mmetsp:Transcript_23947/g.65259  ORF Transcript_23947/g.65259 Transcript_23947/m.65259 type:complete len:239 (+) Transcript_23947:120-836(+)
MLGCTTFPSLLQGGGSNPSPARASHKQIGPERCTDCKDLPNGRSFASGGGSLPGRSHDANSGRLCTRWDAINTAMQSRNSSRASALRSTSPISPSGTSISATHASSASAEPWWNAAPSARHASSLSEQTQMFCTSDRVHSLLDWLHWLLAGPTSSTRSFASMGSSVYLAGLADPVLGSIKRQGTPPSALPMKTPVCRRRSSAHTAHASAAWTTSSTPRPGASEGNHAMALFRLASPYG